MRYSASAARLTIVSYTLFLTGALLVFLMIAPYGGFVFDEKQKENVRLIEVVLPIFFGYLGSASHFIFNASRGRDVPREQ
jgi:hypothetical protein